MFQNIIWTLGVISLVKAATDPNYRLNSKINPSHYSIAITPYFDTQDDRAFTFDGEVSIVLKTNDTNVNIIRLHSKDLIFGADNVTVGSDTSAVALRTENPIEFIKKYDFTDISLAVCLLPNVEYTLKISYTGPIRSDISGFFWNHYFENGVKKWLGAVQSQPTFARKIFPCLDEPQYKAIFSLTIDRPSTFSPSLSNTKLQKSIPLSNGRTRDVFYPTPKMSTYLLAFLVSEFVAAEQSRDGSKEFGVYTRAGARNQAKRVFDYGKKYVTALGEYLGIDYYSIDQNLKLDYIAVPDYIVGGMENWGLINFREDSLLYDSEESSPYDKFRVVSIASHETTHMWFGDLVTCHWWSDIWLNEGFANYFQRYMTSILEPDLEATDYSLLSVYTAYNVDELPEAVPISNKNVNSPEEIFNQFSSFTYAKAESVIRMMHNFIGDAAFKFALNFHLNSNKFGIATPAALYDALSKAVSTYGSLSKYPGVTIAEVMDSWISQPGHPLLTVDVNYNTGNITLTQNRFYTTIDNQTNELYMIPITYTTGNKINFEDTKPAFVMTEKTQEIHEPALLNNTWIIFNIQETGLYRVTYDYNTWTLLGNILENDISQVHHYNRAKIINDLFTFYTIDEVTFEIVHHVFSFLKKETSRAVWKAAIKGFNDLRNKLYGQRFYVKELDAYILRLMEHVINEVGFEPGPNDSHVKLTNRLQIMEFACKLGHEGCLRYYVSLFHSHRNNDVRLPPSVRHVTYCFGLMYGDANDFDFLWNKLHLTNVARVAHDDIQDLGCTKVKSKQIEFLEKITNEDGEIRQNRISTVFSSLLFDHSNVDTVLDFVDEHSDFFNKTFEHYECIMCKLSYPQVLKDIAAALHTDEQFEKFEEFLQRKNFSEEINKPVLKALGKAKAEATWAASHKDEILKNIRSQFTNI